MWGYDLKYTQGECLHTLEEAIPKATSSFDECVGDSGVKDKRPRGIAH